KARDPIARRVAVTHRFARCEVVACCLLKQEQRPGNVDSGSEKRADDAQRYAEKHGYDQQSAAAPEDLKKRSENRKYRAKHRIAYPSKRDPLTSIGGPYVPSIPLGANGRQGSGRQGHACIAVRLTRTAR